MGQTIYIAFRASDVNKLGIKFERMSQTVLKDAQLGLEDVGKLIIDESKAQVPTSTATLRNSAYTVELQTEGQVVAQRVGYGGPNDQINPKTYKLASSYMVPVHEKINATHVQGKAKYLEDPVRDASKLIEKYLAQSIGAHLK